MLTDEIYEGSADAMTLKNAEAGREYEIKSIVTGDEELNSFLFSLGCYTGEEITVVRHRRGGCIVSIKDARYNIDNQLAEAIEVVA
jgi:ferrous iron transport protein A